MIVGKEGQPRSGKSYETVKFDILEALKIERKIYARLNGLDHEKIAAFLSMPGDRVRELLVVMDDDQVHKWLVCETNTDGSLVFPHIEHGALIVVDEVHEYWPTGRAPMPKPNADFFAKHGHIGLDIVLMSQDFKEVHRSAIRRMQRKNIYTKLDALGKDMSYSIRFYSAPTVGKFELTGSEKRDYDPLIWPLYHGIQPGVEGNAVYKTGSKTVWQTAKKPAILMGLGLIVGIFFIGRFFTGGGMVPETKKPKATVMQVTSAQPGNTTHPVLGQPVAGANAPHTVAQRKDSEKAKAPAGIEYILELTESARARFAGEAPQTFLIEFRNQGGTVIERLTREELQALGWTVVKTTYGALATYKDESVIFTPWPTELQYSQSQQTAERIRAAGAPVTSASESQPRPAGTEAGAIISGPVVASGYGDVNRQTQSADVGPAAMR